MFIFNMCLFLCYIFYWMSCNSYKIRLFKVVTHKEKLKIYSHLCAKFCFVILPKAYMVKCNFLVKHFIKMIKFSVTIIIVSCVPIN
jgi:hypothetical protein